jgi:hypothetical protein
MSLIQSGVATWAATSGEDVPELARVMGTRVGPNGETLTIWLPTVQLGRTLTNLERHKEIALFYCRVTDYRSVQVKGTVLSIREGTDIERAQCAAYVEQFAEQCAVIGMTREQVARMRFWPATVIELKVNALYQQTPGPQAGAPWPRH